MVILAHVIGAIFLVNAVPHLAAGLLGMPFPSPFSKPPGVGMSSPVANVLWGGINALIGFPLLFKLGEFRIGLNLDTLLVAAAGWLCAFALARHFTKVMKPNEAG